MSDILQPFLEHPSRPAGTLTYHQLQGFLFAVGAAPEPIRPLEWVPLVFANSSPGYESPEEAQRILAALTAAYHDIGRSALAGTPSLPGDLTVHDDPLANFDDAPLGRWSHGFRVGHEWLRELWDVELPDNTAREIRVSLTTLLFFSSRELAETLHAATGATRPFDALAATMRAAVPNALTAYARLGRHVRQVSTPTNLPH